MNPITLVFNKVFTKEFYRINAGFFLLVIGVCFGFLRDVEHQALAQYFISAPLLMLMPVLVWFLYTLKILNFNSLALKKTEYGFVHSAALVPGPLARALVLVSIQQLMPAWLYGVFLVAVAVHFNQYTAVLETGLALLICMSMVSGVLYWEITHADDEKKVNWLQSRFNFTFTRPFVWFYPSWILGRQPALVIGTKLFSMLIIAGVSTLYLYDHYDERLFAMGCSLAFSSSLVLVYYFHRFENFHFSLLRSLPLSPFRRMGYFLATFIILQLPEFAVMISYFPEEIYVFHLAVMAGFGLSVNLLGYAFLFLKDISLELFIRRVFIMAFLWLVLILFKVPVILLASLQAIAGTVIFSRYFYSFEFDASIDSEK